jgi:sugar phosphate isomerase/epimerase
MRLNTTRRGFLGGAVAAGLAGGAAAEPPGRAGNLKLGVASYSLREFQRGLAIRMIRELNVHCVCIKEFHLRYRSTPEELRRGAAEFRRAGLTITGGGTVYLQKDDDSDIRQYFEYAKTCGMPMMVIGPAHQTLPRIEKFVKEYGIAVAIHNHGPEDKEFPTPAVALKAVEGMDPRVGLCIDVGHTARAGEDVVRSLQAVGARLLDVHIKDLRDLRQKGTDVPVGEGAMPIVAIFQALEKMNYQGCLHLEYEADADSPLMGMAKSLAYMRGVLAGLRG